MSDDGYPRVFEDQGDSYWRWGSPAARTWMHGVDTPLTHKVVPADAIVIERSDLPEVKARVSDGVYGVADEEVIPTFVTVEHAEKWARIWLALADYYREHPPVNEAEVARLRSLILDSGAPLGPTALDATARYLATRVRVTEDGAR